jgi:hypothetical protein
VLRILSPLKIHRLARHTNHYTTEATWMRGWMGPRAHLIFRLYSSQFWSLNQKNTCEQWEPVRLVLFGCYCSSKAREATDSFNETRNAHTISENGLEKLSLWKANCKFGDKIKVTTSRVWSWGSSGSIVSDYGLHDRVIEVRSPSEAVDSSSIFCVQTCFGAHPVFCPMGTGGKTRQGAWRWLLTPI